MELIEQQLCKRLADVLQERLPGISIDGNWLTSATTPKGAEIWRGAKLDVTVGTRSYGAMGAYIRTRDAIVARIKGNGESA